MRLLPLLLLRLGLCLLLLHLRKVGYVAKSGYSVQKLVYVLHLLLSQSLWAALLPLPSLLLSLPVAALALFLGSLTLLLALLLSLLLLIGPLLAQLLLEYFGLSCVGALGGRVETAELLIEQFEVS